MENISYITRKMNIYHAFGIGDQYTIRTYNVLDILISDITLVDFNLADFNTIDLNFRFDLNFGNPPPNL